MTEFPSLPLFTDALIADTTHLSDEEFGRYVKLMIITWRLPNCKMPRDELWHMRRHSVTLDKFNELYKPLLEEFFKCDGNYYYQKRLLSEFSYLRDQRQKQTVKANIRWNKNKDLCYGNAPKPILTKEKEKDTKKKKKNLNLFPESFSLFWEEFPKQRAGSRDKAFEAWLKASIRDNPEKIIEGVKKYSSSDEVLRGFAKGAAAWLNDDRWKNEYHHIPAKDLFSKPIDRDKEARKGALTL